MENITFIYLAAIEFCAVLAIIYLYGKLYTNEEWAALFLVCITILLLAHSIETRCQDHITNYSIKPMLLSFHLFIIIQFLIYILSTLWNKEKMTIKIFLIIRRYAKAIIIFLLVSIYVIFLIDISIMADQFVLDRTKHISDIVPLVEFYIILRLYIFFRLISVGNYFYTFLKLGLIILLFTIIELLIENFSCDHNRQIIIIYLHIFVLLIIYYTLWDKSIKMMKTFDYLIVTKKQKNIMMIFETECAIYYLAIFSIEMIKIGEYHFCIK